MSTNYSEHGEELSDWISQAEAARLQGVTRQAISKLVKSGRLKTLTIAGKVLVSRSGVEGYIPETAGRPSRQLDHRVDRILAIIARSEPGVRRAALERIRRDYPIHPLEQKLGASAEVILDAIDRAGPLTRRGIRGVLAEAAFGTTVVVGLKGWKSLETPKDPPYDFLLDYGAGAVRVKVKSQRNKDSRPMLANEAYRWLSSEMYVVETQRTRGGKAARTGNDTRPYRFGEFDILAVSMEAPTKNWGRFLYTASDWLLPRSEDPRLLLKFQPVSKVPNEDWTDSFEECVNWLRSGKQKQIRGT